MATVSILDYARQMGIVTLSLVARKVVLLHADTELGVICHLVRGKSPGKPLPGPRTGLGMATKGGHPDGVHWKKIAIMCVKFLLFLV